MKHKIHFDNEGIKDIKPLFLVIVYHYDCIIMYMAHFWTQLHRSLRMRGLGP